MIIGGSISGALFSDENKKYRYALWRLWDNEKPALLFIGLNPSTANEIKDDPTVIKMVGFAKILGYGGLYVGNLFSIVSANPEVLFLEPSKEEVNGPNDVAIKNMREFLTTTVIVGWGEWGQNAGLRPARVIEILGESVFCLKINKSGEPCHPLYLPRDSKPIPYYRREVKPLE